MTATKGKNFMIVAVLLGVAAAVVGYYGLTSMASQTAAQIGRASCRERVWIPV